MALDRGGEGLRRDRRAVSMLADPARLELVDVAVVQSLASAAAAGYRRATPQLKPRRLLEQALLTRELARRRGDAARLAEADAAAERAAQEGAGEPRVLAAARLQQALCALDAAQIFADPSGWSKARLRLSQAETALDCTPGRLAGPGLLRGRLIAAEALAGADRRAMLSAIQAFDEGIVLLETRIRATGAGLPENAAARCERAELMIGLGLKLKEAGLFERAARDLRSLSGRLDPAYLPLSWARAETLRGCALRALGETTGEARLMKEAAAAFRGALKTVPIGHSPLDRARAAHGLGLSLQGWGEITGELEYYKSALLAFDRALSQIETPSLPLRPTVAHDRAACLARHAERSGDPKALAEAEAIFKGELALRLAGADPVAWAITQVALARLYEARADLLGDSGERADAAFALTEALDVFAEKGLKSLSEVAHAALRRLKGARRKA